MALEKGENNIDKVELVKDFAGTWSSSHRKIHHDSPITFRVGVAIGSIAQDQMRDNASKQANANAGKGTGSKLDSNYRTGVKRTSTEE